MTGVPNRAASQNDLETAILWLRSYEAEDGDSTKEACLRAASFLEAEVQKRTKGQQIRQLAAQARKELGLPAGVARRQALKFLNKRTSNKG